MRTPHHGWHCCTVSPSQSRLSISRHNNSLSGSPTLFFVPSTPAYCSHRQAALHCLVELSVCTCAAYTSGVCSLGVWSLDRVSAAGSACQSVSSPSLPPQCSATTAQLHVATNCDEWLDRSGLENIVQRVQNVRANWRLP